MIGLRNDDPGRNVKFQDSVDSKLISMIDNYDKAMLDYIGRLYQAVNGEKLNFDNIEILLNRVGMNYERLDEFPNEFFSCETKNYGV